MAMKPDCRPISFTRPRPLRALPASTLAASRARWASSTAVSNPKHLGTQGSVVVGRVDGWDRLHSKWPSVTPRMKARTGSAGASWAIEDEGGTCSRRFK